MTHPGSDRPHQDFSRPRIREFDVFDFEWFVDLAQHGSLHFHPQQKSVKETECAKPVL
jgi:hypothetical protein